MNCETEIYKLPSNDISVEKMKKYEGEYVVIHNEEVVEHSKDFSKILRLAENYPKDEAIITKIFPSNKMMF